MNQTVSLTRHTMIRSWYTVSSAYHTMAIWPGRHLESASTASTRACMRFILIFDSTFTQDPLQDNNQEKGEHTSQRQASHSKVHLWRKTVTIALALTGLMGPVGVHLFVRPILRPVPQSNLSQPRQPQEGESGWFHERGTPTQPFWLEHDTTSSGSLNCSVFLWNALPYYNKINYYKNIF